MSKNYPIEFLETMLLKINEYLEAYNEHRNKYPCDRFFGEIWNFSIKVNEPFLDCIRKEILVVRDEIKEALRILKAGER